MNTKHFVYVTRNLVNQKRYIGVHSTDDLDDGYLGSGKLLRRAVEKHGKDKFVVEQRAFVNSRSEAEELEELAVDESVINDPSFYNLNLGGGLPPVLCGEDNYMYGKKPWTYGRKRPEHAAKMRVMMAGENNPMFAYEYTDDQRKARSDRMKGEKNPFYGKKHEVHPKGMLGKNHTEETKARMSAANKGRPKSAQWHKTRKENNIKKKMEKTTFESIFYLGSDDAS